MDKSDFWGHVFIAAVERYGEERAGQVADRAVKEFEQRFSTTAKGTNGLAAAQVTEVKK
jgi:hypothetical protein